MANGGFRHLHNGLSSIWAFFKTVIGVKYSYSGDIVNWMESEKIKTTMRYSSQIRAARALLGWSQGKLARVAGIGLTTLQRVERNEGVVKGNFSTMLKIQTPLEKAGILFTDDEAGEIGVRLQQGSDE
jgi:DNA-binding XRE family transcriptional regulator